MRGTQTRLNGSGSSVEQTSAAPADVLQVLDPTVLIDFLRGRPAVSRLAGLRSTGDVPATTAINVEEVVRGLRPAEVGAAETLFRGLLVLPVDAEVAWTAGAWRRDFAAHGVTLFQADCLVATTAFVHRATLVTGNPRDFPMRELMVEHWPVGA
ncbi:MAG TPA: type II toxin-antitoxin system VapC family toxin [Friedmanniella sp.]